MIEHLMNEHKEIKELLSMLETAKLNMLSTQQIDSKLFSDLFAVLVFFARELHHEKEEAILF